MILSAPQTDRNLVRKDVDEIDFIYSLIGTPLGYILYFIYEIGITNIGIAIILFTFIIKILMLPLSIKQQKNTAKSAIFAPKVREIQQKYRNNQQKQQEELQKLQQQGYNPMGGCGSMILTFLILFGVLDVVYKPMTHITHTQASDTEKMVKESYHMEIASLFVDEYNNVALLEGDALTKHDEIIRDAEKILAYYNANRGEGEPEYTEKVWETVSADSMKVVEKTIEYALNNSLEDIKAANDGNGKDIMFSATNLFAITDYATTDGNAAGNPVNEKEEHNALKDDAEKKAYLAEHAFSDTVKNAFTTMQTQYGYYSITANGTISFKATNSLQRELYILDTFGTVKEYQNGTTVAFKELYSLSSTEDIEELYENLDFIGIKLSDIPGEHMGFPMLFIPIAAFIFSLLQSFISNRHMEQNNPGQVGGGMKLTMYILPIFSLILVFSVPAGAGFYWTISYVFGIAQTIILNKLYNPQKLRAQAEAEYNERMKRIEIEAKKIRNSDDDNTVSEYKGEKLTQKEINRRKLAEARRQDAIKYGEEYIEDDED